MRERILQPDTVGLDTPALHYLIDSLNRIEDDKQRNILKKRITANIGAIQDNINATATLELTFRKRVLDLLYKDFKDKRRGLQNLPAPLDSLLNNVLQTLMKVALENHGKPKRDRKYPQQKHGAPTFHSM